MVAVSKKSKTDSAPKAKKQHPFFQATPKNFGIGGSPRPKKDLTRFVRWPKCVRLQRQRKILLSRLKTPHALRVFQDALNKNEATQLFRLLDKYRPESAEAKKARLVSQAEARAKGEEPKSKKPVVLQFGINHVTDLIETKQAKLVIIAHDVVPVELTVWMPTLCKKLNIPFCIVKGKARLGQLVHQKTATAVAINAVRKEDQPALDQLIANFQISPKK